MTKTDGNEPVASTTRYTQNGIKNGEYLGLTKREYFAAMAMQGSIANEDTSSARDHALYAISCADALIDALNKQEAK